MLAERDASLTVEMARLQVKFADRGHGAMIQVDGATGSMELLDAAAWLGASGPRLVVGRFKTPVSMEFGIGAPQLVLPTRALLMAAAPRRLVGVQGELANEHLALRVGAFEQQGLRPVVAVDAEFGEVELHAAATTWAGTGATAYDHEGDLAVSWHHGGTHLLAEGLAAHVPGGRWRAGTTTMAAQRIPLGDVALEPAVGWDTSTLEGDAVHRLTGAMNLRLREHHALVRVSIESRLPDKAGASGESVARAQVQVGG